MARIDHTAEAVLFLDVARQVPSNEDETNPAAALAIQEAIAHATLALVEQQRIANLIALSADLDWEARAALHDRSEGSPLRPEIKAALGIGESNA